MSENHETTEATRNRARRRIASRLDAAGWGLFLIWVGVSLLTDLSWGTGLVGVSAIVLLGQMARRSFGLSLEPFWLVVGSLLLVGGVWEISDVDVDLMPILLILAGGALMLGLLRRGSRADWRERCRSASYRGSTGWRCCSWSTDDRRSR